MEGLIDILISAIPDFLDSFVEIVVTAIPDFLGSFVDIVLTATPDLGHHSFHIFMVTGMIAFILVAWHLDYG